MKEGRIQNHEKTIWRRVFSRNPTTTHAIKILFYYTTLNKSPGPFSYFPLVS